jgi:pilus assembly protein Flp/PilA
MSKLMKFLKNESGASASEYALLLGVMGLGIVIASSALSDAIASRMNTAASTIVLAQD